MNAYQGVAMPSMSQPISRSNAAVQTPAPHPISIFDRWASARPVRWWPLALAALIGLLLADEASAAVLVAWSLPAWLFESGCAGDCAQGRQPCNCWTPADEIADIAALPRGGDELTRLDRLADWLLGLFIVGAAIWAAVA